MSIDLTGNPTTNNNNNNTSVVSKGNVLFNLREPKTQQNQQTNPFTGQPVDPNQGQYGGGLDEESQAINSLLNDRNVPMNIKKTHWWVFSRDNSLTFLDEKRKSEKLLNFDIIKIDNLNALPYYDYDFEIEKQFNILRNTFETKLDRSLGTNKAQQINERIAQKSQFNETRQISKDENEKASAGFISKLLNRR